MKRFLLVVLLAIFGVSSAYAADTCTTETWSKLGFYNGKYKLVLVCTADATGNFSYTLSSGTMDNIDGKYFYTIRSYDNTVTDGAELEIRDSLQFIWFDANGNGNDFLDTTTRTREYPDGPNGDHYTIGDEDYAWTIYAENAGAGTINLILEFLD